MDWLGLGKQIFTFGSTGFDIGSDIANSLNFLGVFNNDTYNDVTPLRSINLTYASTTHSTMPLSANNEMINCGTMDQREDVIWGVLSLLVVFLPGAILGMDFILSYGWCGSDWCRWCLSFLMMPVIPLFSVVFPGFVLLMPLIAIFQICRKKKVDQQYQTMITQYIGMESSMESTSQLLLQLFTLLNGYPSTLLQKVTMVASFFQIARCSILSDIEMKIETMKGKALTFKESLIETIYRLPLYASTIIFRIVSLCLAMAYLRYYSIIPMTFLFVIQTIITWERYKKQDYEDAMISETFKLVVCNIGVVTAHGTVMRIDGNTDRKPVEDENDIVKFIKNVTL